MISERRDATGSRLRLAGDVVGDGALVEGGAAEEVVEDARDVDVAVFEEDAETLLRAADGGAGDVEAGDVCLHRPLVEDRLLLLAGQLDAGALEQALVLLVADQLEDVVRPDLQRLPGRGKILAAAGQGDVRGGELRRDHAEMRLDPTRLHQGPDLRQQPVLDARLRKIRAAVAQGDVGSRVEAAQGRLDGGVAPAEDQDLAAEIAVRLAQVTVHVGEILAGDAQRPGEVRAADREDDAAAPRLPWTLAGLRGQDKASAVEPADAGGGCK